MSLFTQYRERLHFKKITKEQAKRKASQVAWNKKMDRIGVLLPTENIEDAVVSKFLKRLKKIAKEVQLLGFANVKELKKPLSIDAFTKKEVDWIWRPKGETVAAFRQQSFDVLINLCQHNCYPLEYIAAACEAKYKIGALTKYPNNYDLMLETDNLENHIRQVAFFLAKFSTQYE